MSKTHILMIVYGIALLLTIFATERSVTDNCETIELTSNATDIDKLDAIDNLSANKCIMLKS